MAATIKIKNSSTTGSVPTSSNLVQGELAVNVTDLGLYTENASGTVVKLNAPSIDDKNTGATKYLTIDTSGNLGLGVTPSAWNSNRKVLQINRASLVGTDGNETNLGSNYYWNGTSNLYIASTYATLYNQGAGAHIWYNAASGTAGNAITFTQAMTLNASGYLGIGTSSPTFALDIATTNSGNIAWQRTGVSAKRFGFSSDNSATYLSNLTDDVTIAVFENAGNLLLWNTNSSITATNGIKFINGAAGNSYMGIVNSQSTNASANYHLYSTGAGAYRFYVGMGGTVYATSTTISSLSDQRHKENIRDLNVGLSEIMALKPRLYDWKEGKGADIKNARGFIAQEFEEVFPDLIDEWKDPAPEGEEPYKSVRADLIPVLVKAIQEQQAIITSLTARIEALEQ